MQSRVSSGSSRGGVSGGMRSGSTKAKMLIRSSTRFSIGVPVMAQLRSREMLRTDLGRLRLTVLDALGLVEHDDIKVKRWSSTFRRVLQPRLA